MASVMMTVTLEEGARPSLAEAARLLNVDQEDLDTQFGIVSIDPKRRLYTVMVREEALKGRPPDESGPFANPGISHFGRPR